MTIGELIQKLSKFPYDMDVTNIELSQAKMIGEWGYRHGGVTIALSVAMRPQSH